MKNLYRVSLIILLGLEVGFAQNSFAIEITFEGAKAYYLSNGRIQLMDWCNWGRKVNSAGLSAFDPLLRDPKPIDISVRSYEAAASGRAAAAFEVCPDVK